MKTEDDIRMDISKIEDATIRKVCELLQGYTKETRQYLAIFVASLCDISLNDLLTNTKSLSCVQSRWLYWFAYRYMTNERYESISKHTKEYRAFTDACVSAAVSKMSMMVSEDTIWKKRWYIIKRVIRIILDNDHLMSDVPDTTLQMKVTAPKGVNLDIQVEKK